MNASLLGQRITWTVTSTGAERSGVVWSDGPVTDTAWVIPDERGVDEGRAVCVHIGSDNKNAARGVDERRSTVTVHVNTLSRLKHRRFLPHGNHPMGYEQDRGTGPRCSVDHNWGCPRCHGPAYGTCPVCLNRARVARLEARRTPDGQITFGPPGSEQRLVGAVRIAVVAHRHLGAPCSGAGQVPAETTFTPGYAPRQLTLDELNPVGAS